MDDWLDSVEVTDFEGLKELMLTEQIKRRASLEIRQHYLDDWEEFKTASILAEKYDKHEAVTRDTRRLDHRAGFRKPFEKNKKKFVAPNNREKYVTPNDRDNIKVGITKELRVITQIKGKFSIEMKEVGKLTLRDQE